MLFFFFILFFFENNADLNLKVFVSHSDLDQKRL